MTATTAPASDFWPGALVRARGREWVVQNGSTPEWLRLRPLSGADDESIALIPELELTPIQPATFAPPDPAHPGNHAAARLLHDALRLTLRAGAGPFRSFGSIAVEPRAWQLVPLLMALRLPAVRLLIADDVGIGKTIEAALIARELMDRGEISRLSVLCPPHLVEQWQGELREHFGLHAIALTASTAARLERELPHGTRLLEHHPITVISLDYIKSERHREQFLASAPECIIVDEAHTCTRSGAGRQLRFALLQRLAQDAQRHLILLTATPHSGDETAFYNLLSLLDPKFADLQGGLTTADNPLRQQLARHFVQRRRKDIIAEWQAADGFPRRMTSELTYQLSGDWGAFFDDVQSWCRELAETLEAQHSGSAGGAHRLIWYATLALLRCVASSPAAAVQALSARLHGDLISLERLYDGEDDDLTASDLEPPATPEHLPDAAQPRLRALITRAQKLCGAAGDPKLATLIQHTRELLAEGFTPVIFCRFIATAHYVAEHLRAAFPQARVTAVTGELTPTERRERVEDMEDAPQRILVATDCLSEGINLQHLFTAAVHYDLAWNPTRHEQREGRIDRFGQRAPEVRCTMLYGQDNPVDGFVLNVILRKAREIQRELGILVPIPEDETRIQQALVKAALMRRSSVPQQASLDFGSDLAPLQTQWRDALEKAKANRTIFAQRGIHPEEALPEWHKQQRALGSAADVEHFLRSACTRLGAPLEEERCGALRFLPKHLPEALRQRLADAGITGEQTLIPAELHRSHPIVTLLAQHLLEDTLESQQPIAARCAVTVTADVQLRTTVYLLRLRHQLTSQRRGAGSHTMLAEETLTLAVQHRSGSPRWLADDDTAPLLHCTPAPGTLGDATRQREIQAALDFIAQPASQQRLQELAQQRAQNLLADHQRVRDAARDSGQHTVRACLPVDIIGAYILLPDAL